MSVEEFEQLYDNVKEAEETLDREREIFGEVLDKDDLMDELNKLGEDDVDMAQLENIGVADH